MSHNNDLKFWKLWLKIGYGLVLLVVFLSLAPDPPDLMEFDKGDKVGHLIAYLTLMLWFANLYRERAERLSTAMAFLAMGTALELVQALIGYRTFQYADMAANAAGVFLGWSLAQTWLGFFLVKIDGMIR